MSNATKRPTELRVDDVVRVYTHPFAGQRGRVAFLADAGITATVVMLEPVTSKKRTLYAPGESARVPVDKCRKVEGLSPALPAEGDEL